MRVRSTSPDFWRGQTFDQWDGRTWTQSDDKPKAVSGLSPLDIPRTVGDDVAGGGQELVQTFYLEAVGPNTIFNAYRASELYFPITGVFQLSDGTLRAGVDLEEGAVYTVISTRQGVTEDRLRVSDRFRPNSQVLDRYTTLPAATERVRQLAKDVTADAPTTYDKVRALEAWMGENTQYSLDTPPLPDGADAVDQFLFVDRVGFCEQIGSSLVVMLRSLGIPARLAVGYAPGNRNPFTGMYEVHADDAHAWAEVYFPGVGWQGFDPTAFVPFAGDAGAGRAGAGLFTYLGQHLPRPPLWLFQSVGAVLVVGLLLVAMAIVIGMWRGRRRRRRDRTWLDEWMEKLELEGANRGRPRRSSETVREYVGILRRSVIPDPRLTEVAATFEEEQFSGGGASMDRRRRAEEALMTLVGSGRGP